MTEVAKVSGTIVRSLPPNYAELCAAFPGLEDARNIIYAWGDKIHNPDGGVIGRELLAHESVHMHRQKQMPGESLDARVHEWWKRYIADMAFRLGEEVPAHRAEWKTYVELVRDRNARAREFLVIAQRLAGPLYGNLLTLAKAKEILLA